MTQLTSLASANPLLPLLLPLRDPTGTRIRMLLCKIVEFVTLTVGEICCCSGLFLTAFRSHFLAGCFSRLLVTFRTGENHISIYFIILLFGIVEFVMLTVDAIFCCSSLFLTALWSSFLAGCSSQLSLTFQAGENYISIYFNELRHPPALGRHAVFGRSDNHAGQHLP